MSWCKQCISEYNQERKGSKAHSRAEYYKTIQKYLPNDDEVIMYLEHRYGPKWIEQLAGTPAPVRNIPEPADANEPEEVLGKDGYPLGPWNEDM
jgi:hypothetical protein